MSVPAGEVAICSPDAVEDEKRSERPFHPMPAAEQYVEAIKVLKKMVKSDSLNPWPLEQLADCYDAIDMDDFADKFRAKAQRLRRKKG